MSTTLLSLCASPVKFYFSVKYINKMEQFRSDFLNQAWTSLALPDLFHFLPAAFQLSIPQKWNYASYLVNAGYPMFLGDMNSNFKEA